MIFTLIAIAIVVIAYVAGLWSDIKEKRKDKSGYYPKERL